MNEWVSVEDRLPEFNTEVLCFVKRNTDVNNYETYFWLWKYYTDETWGDSEFNIEEDEVVTHWMPLPKTPEGK